MIAFCFDTKVKTNVFSAFPSRSTMSRPARPCPVLLPKVCYLPFSFPALALPATRASVYKVWVRVLIRNELCFGLIFRDCRRPKPSSRRWVGTASLVDGGGCGSINSTTGFLARNVLRSLSANEGIEFCIVDRRVAHWDECMVRWKFRPITC